MFAAFRSRLAFNSSVLLILVLFRVLVICITSSSVADVVNLADASLIAFSDSVRIRCQ